LPQRVEIALDRRIDHLPRGAQVVERHGLQVVPGRVEHDLACVGLGVLGDQRLLLVARSTETRAAVSRLRFGHVGRLAAGTMPRIACCRVLDQDGIAQLPGQLAALGLGGEHLVAPSGSRLYAMRSRGCRSNA